MAVVPGTLRAGDMVRLELPVASRWVHPDPRMGVARGTIAPERGPVLHCVGYPDLPDGHDVDARSPWIPRCRRATGTTTGWSSRVS